MKIVWAFRQAYQGSLLGCLTNLFVLDFNELLSKWWSERLKRVKSAQNSLRTVMDVLKWEARGETKGGTAEAPTSDPTLAFINFSNQWLHL